MASQGFHPSHLVGAPVYIAQYGPGIVRSINKDGRYAVQLTGTKPVTATTAETETPAVPARTASVEAEATLSYLRNVTADQMSQHAVCAPGTCILTTLGTGVLVAHRPSSDVYIVRLWRPRGTGSALAYLRREALLRPLPAAVGIRVTTPSGPGVVVGFQRGVSAGEEGGDVFVVTIDRGGDGGSTIVESARVSCPVAKVCDYVLAVCTSLFISHYRCVYCS